MSAVRDRKPQQCTCEEAIEEPASESWHFIEILVRPAAEDDLGGARNLVVRMPFVVVEQGIESEHNAVADRLDIHQSIPNVVRAEVRRHPAEEIERQPPVDRSAQSTVSIERGIVDPKRSLRSMNVPEKVARHRRCSSISGAVSSAYRAFN